ncbi:MAG: hypothetical protein RIT35_690, partial [Pseudomonadota bacterium]
MSKYAYRFIVIFATILIAVALFCIYELAPPPKKKAIPDKTQLEAAHQSKVDIGGHFTLLDVNGNEVRSWDLPQPLKLMYFGFTTCPDICPAGLQTISNVMQLLGEDGQKIKPILITIDPARDTVTRLREYMTNFDPSILALTGSEEQIAAVAKSYKVYYAKVQMNETEPQNYMIN